MKKTVRITIDIEREILIGFSANYSIRESLFTEYDHLFDAPTLLHRTKQALHKLEGTFSMLTITLQAGSQHDTYPPIVDSYRFIGDRDKTIRVSKIRGNKYGQEPNTDNGWRDTNTKEVFSRITEICEAGNRTFIETLRQLSQQPA